MQENEFEKQVRKLLDDFHLTPSASVWQKVRSRIAERRRKWPLIVLLVATMVGTSYLLYHKTGKSDTKNQSVATANINDGTKQHSSFGPDSISVQPANHASKTNVDTNNTNDIYFSLKQPIKAVHGLGHLTDPNIVITTGPALPDAVPMGIKEQALIQGQAGFTDTVKKAE